MVGTPELLAPAGDLESLRAALDAGADAVYFGLDDGFNARARATNISLNTLLDVVGEIHAHGARAYLTLNTLIFESELPRIEEILRRVALSGVDALIVQDPAVALLAKAIYRDFEIHASTQMTISSPEAGRFAKLLGITRVVVPRELSVKEIIAFHEQSDLELEMFIHGALCVSWSGQCLTSEAWGGRSANRGQCAQACRLPYELILDGKKRNLGDVKYLLSPKDLTGLRAVDQVRGVVHGLKIEGRQKGPHYVATAVRGYRRLIDGLEKEGSITSQLETQAQDDLLDMTLSYSRGFSDGFLAGSDHQTLVEGRFPKHRGVYLGRISEIHPDGILVQEDHEGRPWTGAIAKKGGRPSTPKGVVSSPLPGFGGSSESSSGPALPPLSLKAGMGFVIDSGQPEAQEMGGPIFRVQSFSHGVFLGLARETCDLRHCKPGDRVWVTSAPSRDGRQASSSKKPLRSKKDSLSLELSGTVGQPLRLLARTRNRDVTVESQKTLELSRGRGLDQAILHEKLGALGETSFVLQSLSTSSLDPGLHIPVSELKQLRRLMVTELESAVIPLAVPDIAKDPVLPGLRQSLSVPSSERRTSKDTELLILCRRDEQLDAVIESGVVDSGDNAGGRGHVALDWMEMVGLRKAVQRSRDHGLEVTLATVRVQKPGEEVYDRRIAALNPDCVLIRHWAALMHFRDLRRAQTHEESIPAKLVGDFSLNVTNSLSAHFLVGLGLDLITASHDLDKTQLFALLGGFDPSRLAVTVHHHIPAFYTEHCVYSHLLSEGRDYNTCGRPCEQHALSLRDPEGLDHPVIVDVECRNTVFNARAQSAAFLVPKLLEKGVGQLRIEFAHENKEQAQIVIESYLALIRGQIDSDEVVRRVGGHEQFGVTQGTMAHF